MVQFVTGILHRHNELSSADYNSSLLYSYSYCSYLASRHTGARRYCSYLASRHTGARCYCSYLASRHTGARRYCSTYTGHPTRNPDSLLAASRIKARGNSTELPPPPPSSRVGRNYTLGASLEPCSSCEGSRFAFTSGCRVSTNVGHVT